LVHLEVIDADEGSFKGFALTFFNVLQLLFDAIFLFGILFLFNYSVTQSRKKAEDQDVLKSAQAQEMKEQLQELLLTLKQLGSEVSENIQKEVRAAEEKTDFLQKLIRKAQRVMEKSEKLKVEPLNASSKPKDALLKNKSKAKPDQSSVRTELIENNNTSGMLGLSSELVREVYRLVDTGNDLKFICDKTELSQAEIQLILNLRGNRFTTPN